MKNITIAGRLTKDAVQRRTQSGDPVLGFTVAVDDRSGKEKKSFFFDCALWGNRGPSLEKYLVKGASVTVSGDFGTREYEGKAYPTVRVNDVTLQGGKSSETAQDRSGGDYGTASGTSGQQANFSNAMDDDIPFNMEWR